MISVSILSSVFSLLLSVVCDDLEDEDEGLLEDSVEDGLIDAETITNSSEEEDSVAGANSSSQEGH